MCGIYITNIPYQKEEIEQKLSSIVFRGPDFLGVLKREEVYLGHLRLSILDLDSRSNQPYTYQHLHIVFNGEIYNFESIKQELIEKQYVFETTSDTEVLVKGYHCWGKDLLSKLNGMFAFAIYDEQNNQVFCARDRLGVKPFYYYWKDGKFEVCSQLRPLHSTNFSLNHQALSIYLDCGYIPSPLTIYNDVYKLSPGSFMILDLNSGQKEVQRYWDLSKVKMQRISYKQAKEELHKLLIDAVKIRLQSDVPLGTFLSGGIDSAIVSAIAAKYSEQPIKTFTIAFEDPNFDESKVAKAYAEIIGSEHTETLCRPSEILEMLPHFRRVYDEPFADSSALPSLLLNKIAKQYVTVALSGDGGDESFIGYWHLMLVDKFKKISWLPYILRKAISKIPLHKLLGVKPETYQGILNSKNENELIAQIFTWFGSIKLKQDLSWIQEYYGGYQSWAEEPLQRAADLNIKLWLENDSNVKVDRASMAFSVESRSPFLDYRIVEWARTLPISYRFDGKITKKIVRDILKEYIPEKIFTQPKKGFAVPLGNWIRSELKSDILDKLSDDFLRTIPNLDIIKFKKQLNQHLDGKYDYSFNIWKLYVLALWCEEFKMKIS